MKIGIIGLPQSGKKTLFKLLASEKVLDKHHDPRKPVSGVAEIPDPRFERLVSLYRPQRSVRSRLEITLFPSLDPRGGGAAEYEKELGDVEALCYVVRAFEDRSIYHVEGSVDAARDIATINSELILHDLIFVEKRLERIAKQERKVKEDALHRERELLARMKDSLEGEIPLRLVELSRAERALTASYPLLTAKGAVVVLNVSDEQLGSSGIVEPLRVRYGGLKMGIIAVAVKTEAEISALESPTERAEFMKAMGLDNRAIHSLCSLLIETLDLVSFFTVRNKEVRQWLIKRGSTALDAAGTIHTDMARGFIRAEVIKYDDLVSLGSEERIKAEGKLGLKGKEYPVEDGDILSIRFNI